MRLNEKTSRLSLGIISVSFMLTACINEQDINQFVDNIHNADLNVSVTEPIERDYAEIKESGVLRMITMYSSSTYFLHQGIEWGFEYELVSKFAEEHDLALKIVIVGPDENPYDLLNSGKGDIIAANYTITPERKKYVEFTRPYNLVDQVLVFSDAIKNPPETIKEVAKRGIPITVRRNSSYYHRLRELQQNGLNLSIHVVPNEKDTESLLFDISKNLYMATVADNNLLQATNRYMGGLVKGPVIAENDTIAWAIRKNASTLETQLNRFLYDHFRFGDPGEDPKRSAFLNILRKRYFKKGPQIADYYDPTSPLLDGISPYDDLVKSIADSAGLDWLMITAIIAQETKFNPKAKSWAGAMGLMQIIPRYSEISKPKLLYKPEINIREGVRILSEHLDHYSYMDRSNQWAFALGAYNAGPGHIADARRLAIDHNDNPNEWENVAEALLKLMQRKYYKNARYGFCRGIQTVQYVQEIKNRYKTYKSIVALAEYEQKSLGPGVLGMFN
ncbi:MAG TPA: transglycosylase SLT domain-containing protein [Balneolaceae bacterium]